MSQHDWSVCGEQTPRMKGPCARPRAHMTHPAWKDDRSHRAAATHNEDTPKLREFRRIVEAGLDNGVQLSYVEIGELMGRQDIRSVANYGLGTRYTKLRQKMFEERGIKVDNHRRTPEASHKIVEDMRRVLSDRPPKPPAPPEAREFA